jgi:predicted alpha/beta superfamily hydrolase
MRHAMTVLPTRTAQADGYPWAHEVRIAVPPSYEQSDRRHPTLWITDGSFIFDLAVGILSNLVLHEEAPPLVLVGVGAPPDLGQLQLAERRMYEYGPLDDYLHDGPGMSAVRDRFASLYPEPKKLGGGARAFLDFLVDDLRSSLSDEFRLDPADHGLFGISAAGLFVGYALLSRPGAFAKYICGSPYLCSGGEEVFRLEEEYAAAHDDLPARVFFGAGEAEIDDLTMGRMEIVSSMVRFAERLRVREYPSLQITSRIFPQETHDSTIPLTLSWGVRTLWADVITKPVHDIGDLVDLLTQRDALPD